MNNVLSIINSIQAASKEAPCKKAIQKVIYLIQEAGGSLGFDYRIHFYGPYSADLDTEIRYLCSCGDLTIKETGHGHLISVNDISETPSISPNIQNVISIFGSKKPAQLELLTTALYVQRALSNPNSEDIIAGVIKIKGQKYEIEQIKDSISELKAKKYF